ncbi:MAG: helix-turn-helix transcriptional regulator, partial [Microvirga sp.]
MNATITSRPFDSPRPSPGGYAEVAQYCGLSERTVGDWVAKSLLPPPLPGTNRWDLKAVDQHLDRLSGLTTADRE